MQYKIPVQIENEDPIFLWLSLRQLTIIMIWWWIWYSAFKSLAPNLWAEIAAIPFVLIVLLALVIAKFRIAEMTFIQFILAFIRSKVNYETRIWMKWIDSFQPIDIWFLTNNESITKEKVDFKSKIDKISQLEEKLNKI
jgi:glucan phosphoethanolaminetransferase (alkaline phosphatase superfamily)